MSDLGDLYQELLLDHYRRPRNCGALEDADGVADGNNPLCGDVVRVFVKVRDGVVTDVSFQGSGCAISTASASIMTESVKGKSVEQARTLFRKFHNVVTHGADPSDNGPPLGKLEVFTGVGKFPARVKCATLAWHTLEAALAHKSEPVTTE